ncbi:hypothetical protein BT69DRAFT_1282851 [Atractiella rhizophila]|nr:hypothetical protein BT69DRAFT_1282851 [Atractiella rhizophila]
MKLKSEPISSTVQSCRWCQHVIFLFPTSLVYFENLKEPTRTTGSPSGNILSSPTGTGKEKEKEKTGKAKTVRLLPSALIRFRE